MTQAEFLDTLRRRLGGLPPAEIDEIIGDYETHFKEGWAKGRSEGDIAEALGDPLRLARELRAESGFRRWEMRKTFSNFILVLFNVLALMTVDVVLLLPALAILLLLALICGLIASSLSIIGLLLITDIFHWDTFFPGQTLIRVLSGITMLGFGGGGSALLIVMTDWVVRLLGRYTRLHYIVLDQVEFVR
jgi:uncharacterized membrane protein